MQYSRLEEAKSQREALSQIVHCNKALARAIEITIVRTAQEAAASLRGGKEWLNAKLAGVSDALATLHSANASVVAKLTGIEDTLAKRQDDSDALVKVEVALSQIVAQLTSIEGSLAKNSVNGDTLVKQEDAIGRLAVELRNALAKLSDNSEQDIGRRDTKLTDIVDTIADVRSILDAESADGATGPVATGKQKISPTLPTSTKRKRSDSAPPRRSKRKHGRKCYKEK
jgi:hypothetical protein